MPIASSGNVSSPTIEYLSDIPYRFLHTQQGWGSLGLDCLATVPWIPRTPLRIGDKEYAKGLGHHASGEIAVELNGEYDTFEAEIGIQPQEGGIGSVEFIVYVDDALKYQSGIMRGTDPAKHVQISVAGAHELKLVVSPADNDIHGDCANWAEARLTRASSSVIENPLPRLDAAPFARVVTSDPERMEGCRASRVEEYRAEDVYMTSDVLPDKNGYYVVPATSGASGCIGLQWLERRPIRELALEYAKDSQAPLVDDVKLQYWSGESAWQGQWVPLEKALIQEGNRLIFRQSSAAHLDDAQGTRKVRWIFPPSSKPVVIAGFRAITATIVKEADLSIELERPLKSGDATIEVYNGAFLSPASGLLLKWDTRSPFKARVTYALLDRGKSERTVLRFQFPENAFGVAVDDVIAKGCVYVREAGLFIRLLPEGPSLTEYNKQIKGRKTILEEVRALPDQTFDQALTKVHNPKQNTGPVMLSLACDNRKFVLEQDGAIRFCNDPASSEGLGYFPLKNAAEMRPLFGSGKSKGSRRFLEGRGLPSVTMEREDGQLIYRQRTFVAPLDQVFSDNSLSIHEKPAGVMELVIWNPSTEAQSAMLSLSFLADVTEKTEATVELDARYALVRKGDHLLAWLDLHQNTLKTEINGGNLTLRDEVPAGKSMKIVILIPGWKANREELENALSADELYRQMSTHWERVLSPAARIDVPDDYLMDIIRASQVHCLIAARNEENGKRIAPWIASMSYGPLESEGHSIVRGMEFLGHHEFARRSLDYYVHRYNDQGFLTTGYTLMGTGWHLWSLGEHYELTRDATWIRTVTPRVKRVCNWIQAQVEKTRQTDSAGNKRPENGLMPPGVMADWNAFAYHFCLNGYYYAGLMRAAQAMKDCGDTESAELLINAAKFRDDILQAYRWTQSRMPVYELRSGEWVPGYPSQVHGPGPTNNFFPGQDGNRSWCYDVELGAHQLVPQGVLPPDSREVTWMMDHMEDVQFLADGWFDYDSQRNHADWFNLGGFSKVQPYYCRNAEIYAMRDDVKPFIRSYFNALASLLNTEILCLWEHFNGAGAWNKTHETGYFLHQTRLMLVTERGNELWLAPMCPSAWFKDGKIIKVENAPTLFGPVSYWIDSRLEKNIIQATIQSPSRQKPEAIVLRLRHPEGKPMKTVKVNGNDHRDFNAEREYVRVKPQSGSIEVRVTY